MLSSSTSEQAFADYIDQTRTSGSAGQNKLLALLPENHPAYQGRANSSMVRLRSYALAALYEVGVDNNSFAYIIDVLENSGDAYSVAAAARNIRAIEKPHPDLAKYLISAISNVWNMDKPICFASFNPQWPLQQYSTALEEIFSTLSYMGAYAANQTLQLEELRDNYKSKFNPATYGMLCDCIANIQADNREIKACCLPPLNTQLPLSSGQADEPLGNIQLQDQNGNYTCWNEFFYGSLSLVAFFYVTCSNPKKCSQTIYNLAAIQNMLAKIGLLKKVRIAAITYTAEIDSPDTLKHYGQSRGLNFNEQCKMFRCANGITPLSNILDLQVNYIGDTVNQHSIELFLFNEYSQLTQTFSRIQAEPIKVVDEIEKRLTG